MNFSIDLTQIILAIIGIVGSVVTAYCIPLIKQKTNEKTYNAIMLACNTAVYFAEQWYYSEDGEIKKQHALEHAQNELEARGIHVDIELISECIEAEVKKLKIALKNAGEE